MVDLLKEDNKEPVVIAKGIAHQGAVHGMINGGGIMPSKDKRYGVRFTPTSDKFLGWEIITYGIEDDIKFKKYERVKQIIVKEEKKIDDSQQELKSEDLF